MAQSGPEGSGKIDDIGEVTVPRLQRIEVGAAGGAADAAAAAPGPGVCVSCAVEVPSGIGLALRRGRPFRWRRIMLPVPARHEFDSGRHGLQAPISVRQPRTQHGPSHSTVTARSQSQSQHSHSTVTAQLAQPLVTNQRATATDTRTNISCRVCGCGGLELNDA